MGGSQGASTDNETARLSNSLLGGHLGDLPRGEVVPVPACARLREPVEEKSKKQHRGY